LITRGFGLLVAKGVLNDSMGLRTAAQRRHSNGSQPYLEGVFQIKQQAMQKRHILIVDDDQNTLRSMEFVLEAANHKVTTTADSHEALEK
jgi:PleD family two-component response regulator